MKNKEKYADLIMYFIIILNFIINFIIIGFILSCIVSATIQCVAETGMHIEMIKSGKVPMEVNNV